MIKGLVEINKRLADVVIDKSYGVGRIVRIIDQQVAFGLDRIRKRLVTFKEEKTSENIRLNKLNIMNQIQNLATEEDYTKIAKTKLDI